MTRRLSQNTVILLISNVGSALLSFLLMIMIGRFYGESGLGLYASVLAWIFPLSFVVEFGFGTLITRDIAQQPELASDYLRLTWQFRYVVGGFIIIALWALSTEIVDNPLDLIISTPLVIVLPAYSAYTAVFRAYQRMQPIAVLNLGMLFAQTGLTGIALLTQADLTWIFIINTLTSLGQLTSAHWIYRHHFYKATPRAGELRLRDLIRRSRPFAFAGVLSALQARFSILWLETVSTNAVVGLFVAALRFIDGARMIPNALFGAVYPTLSTLSDNRPALNRLFIRMSIFLVSYSIVVVGLLTILGDELLLITFGVDFILAETALVLMGVMLIPFLLRSGWSLYWYALGREKAVNRILLLNLVTLIILAFLTFSTGTNPLDAIVRAMLYTEVVTCLFMLISEFALWKTSDSTSQTA